MKALVNAWNRVSDDHDVRNDFSMWKSTDFLRHAVGEVEGRQDHVHVCM